MLVLSHLNSLPAVSDLAELYLLCSYPQPSFLACCRRFALFALGKSRGGGQGRQLIIPNLLKRLLTHQSHTLPDTRLALRLSCPLLILILLRTEHKVPVILDEISLKWTHFDLKESLKNNLIPNEPNNVKLFFYPLNTTFYLLSSSIFSNTADQVGEKICENFFFKWLPTLNFPLSLEASSILRFLRVVLT